MQFDCRIRSLTITLLIIPAASLLIFATPLEAGQESVPEWKVAGQSTILALASVAQLPNVAPPTFTLTFKNLSTKGITAFSVSGAVRLDVEYFELEHGLLPGDSQELEAAPSPLVGGTSYELQVSTVLFEDGTFAGSASQAEGITFHRMGRAVEQMRLRAIFEAAPAGMIDDAAIASLKARVGDLPTNVEAACAGAEAAEVRGAPVTALRSASAALRESFFVGVSNARSEALQAIGQLNQLPQQARNGSARTRAKWLDHLRERYREVTQKHERGAWLAVGGGAK